MHNHVLNTCTILGALHHQLVIKSRFGGGKKIKERRTDNRGRKGKAKVKEHRVTTKLAVTKGR